MTIGRMIMRVGWFGTYLAVPLACSMALLAIYKHNKKHNYQLSKEASLSFLERREGE